jgi:hypothetical protein
MGNWRTSIVAMRLDSGETSGDSGESHKSKLAVARRGPMFAVVRSGLGMSGP